MSSASPSSTPPQATMLPEIAAAIERAERVAAQIPDVPANTPLRPIRKVGVIGAGTMGGGITMNFLNAGLPVVLLEMKQEALDRGLATIRRNYENSMKKGKLTAEQVEARMALITPTLTYDGLRDVDLVIEAVFEDMGVKETVFKTLDDVVQPGAILASNTSYLNIDRWRWCAARRRRPTCWPPAWRWPRPSARWPWCRVCATASSATACWRAMVPPPRA
jgi:threonine dehydrogenase-like Zn-dependent dehydrogenase